MHPARQQRVRDTIKNIADFIDGDQELTPQQYKKYASQSAEEYLRLFEAGSTYHLTRATEKRLNEWCASEKGKQATAELIEAVIQLLARVSHTGQPGHDKRHMLKTGISALRYITNQKAATGYKGFAVIAALLHDFGRLIEQRYYEKPMGGVKGTEHPKLSLLCLQELCAHFIDIPQELIDHLLYAVGVHQRARNHEPFIAQVVQRADREQIVGAEAIMRMVAFDVGLHGLRIDTHHNMKRRYHLPLPGTEDDLDLMHHIEFYTRNLLPFIGRDATRRANELKIISATFLWLASTDVIRDQLFTPELQVPIPAGAKLVYKPPLSRTVWSAVKKGVSPEIQQHIDRLSPMPLEELIDVLISAPHATVLPHQKKRILSQIKKIKDRMTRQRLREGIAYAIVMLKQQEEADVKLLKELIHDEQQTELVRTIARGMLHELGVRRQYIPVMPIFNWIHA